MCLQLRDTFQTYVTLADQATNSIQTYNAIMLMEGNASGTM